MSFHRMFITCKGKKNHTAKKPESLLTGWKKTPYLDLVSTALGGRSQSQKATCCVIPLKCNVQNRQIFREREKVIVGGRGGGVGRLSGPGE